MKITVLLVAVSVLALAGCSSPDTLGGAWPRAKSKPATNAMVPRSDWALSTNQPALERLRPTKPVKQPDHRTKVEMQKVIAKRKTLDLNPTASFAATAAGIKSAQAAFVPGTNVVFISLVPVVPPEAGSYGARYNCPKDPSMPGHVWQRKIIKGDQWFLPFNAEDQGTNATSFAPCVTRYGPTQPTGKAVPENYGQFFSANPSAMKAADEFMLKWRTEGKRRGTSSNYGMTMDGQVIRIDQ